MATPAGRPEKIIQRVLSLDREADDILHREAPTKKAHGRFLSRLLYEHAARKDAHTEVLRLYGLRPKDEGIIEKIG